MKVFLDAPLAPPNTLGVVQKVPPILALSIAFAVGIGACAGSDPEINETPVATESLAIVALTWAQNEPGLAQVYVIDHPAGGRTAALEVLSLSAADLVLDTSLGVGECRIEGSRSTERPAGPVEGKADAVGTLVLRDAGEIAVDAGMGSNVLDSRWFPEASLDISGVSYAGLIGPRRGASRQPIEVFADGSPEVGPFRIELTPPPSVKLLAVAGHDVARGRVQLGPNDLMQHLDIAWEPADAPASDEGAAPATSDLTIVAFERRTFGATWTISCVVADDGHFAIPSGALMALPDLGADRTDSVFVRRISSASFSARHLSEGLALAVSEDQAYVE